MKSTIASGHNDVTLSVTDGFQSIVSALEGMEQEVLKQIQVLGITQQQSELWPDVRRLFSVMPHLTVFHSDVPGVLDREILALSALQALSSLTFLALSFCSTQEEMGFFRAHLADNLADLAGSLVNLQHLRLFSLSVDGGIMDSYSPIAFLGAGGVGSIEHTLCYPAIHRTFQRMGSDDETSTTLQPIINSLAKVTGLDHLAISQPTTCAPFWHCLNLVPTAVSPNHFTNLTSLSLSPDEVKIGESSRHLKLPVLPCLVKFQQLIPAYMSKEATNDLLLSLKPQPGLKHMNLKFCNQNDESLSHFSSQLPQLIGSPLHTSCTKLKLFMHANDRLSKGNVAALVKGICRSLANIVELKLEFNAAASMESQGECRDLTQHLLPITGLPSLGMLHMEYGKIFKGCSSCLEVALKRLPECPQLTSLYIGGIEGLRLQEIADSAIFRNVQILTICAHESSRSAWKVLFDQMANARRIAVHALRLKADLLHSLIQNPVPTLKHIELHGEDTVEHPESVVDALLKCPNTDFVAVIDYDASGEEALSKAMNNAKLSLEACKAQVDRCHLPAALAITHEFTQINGG